MNMNGIIKLVKDAYVFLIAINEASRAKGGYVHDPLTHEKGKAKPGKSVFNELMQGFDSLLNLVAVCNVEIRPQDDGAIALVCTAPAPVGDAVYTEAIEGETYTIVKDHGSLVAKGKCKIRTEKNVFVFSILLTPEWFGGHYRFALATAHPGEPSELANKRGLEEGQVLTYEEVMERHLRVEPTE